MTAIFENYKTNASFKSPAIAWAWHQDFPLVAISTSNGVVSIYNDVGERVEDTPLSRSINCTAIVWHPTEYLLCTGWKDGVIYVYNDTDRKSHEPIVPSESEIKCHTATISAMKWTPDGSRLITADVNGLVGVWKSEKNRLINVTFYQTKEHGITDAHIIFKKSEEEWQFFFTGGSNPTADVYVATTDNGLCSKTNISFKSQVVTILFHEDKSCIVALTYDAMLYLYSVSKDLKIDLVTKSKISIGSKALTASKEKKSSTNSSSIHAKWIGRGVLATCSLEKMIRIWNLDTDENGFLSSDKIEEPLMCFTFNSKKRVITAGSADGKMFFWRYIGGHMQEESKGSADWEEYTQYDCQNKLVDVQWGPGEELLAVSFEDRIEILHESQLRRKMRANIITVQTAVDSIAVIENVHLFDENAEDGGKVSVKPIKCRGKVKEIDLTTERLLISSGKSVELYEIKEGMVRFQTTIEVPSQAAALHDEGIFIANANRVEVYNFAGTKKQTIQMTEAEGQPTIIDVQKDFIAIASKNGFVKLFQSSGREAKQVSQSKRIFHSEEHSVEPEHFQRHQGSRRFISSIKCNNNGTKIGVLSHVVHAHNIHEPSTELYVYNIEQDKIDLYDFKEQSRFPMSLYWDQIEPKLLAVEVKNFTINRDADIDDRIAVCTLFSTPDHGIMLQDTLPLDRHLSALVGLAVPSLYFIMKEHQQEGEQTGNPASHLIERKYLRDFEGINIKDDKTRDALLQFSYYLTIGNMEEAYKSVKQIKDASVWNNMAQMCVKTRKMEVAEICLGNMEDARAARALRETRMKEPQLEAQIAMLAIQLGLREEAERLYLSCRRYDLLSEMYQATDQWEKALAIAEKHDRVNMCTTHYKYARHLESMGDLKGAIAQYEKSKTHSYEVPRMLFDAGRIPELEEYVAANRSDKQLLNWWAKYCEGNGEYQEAINLYTECDDFLSQVRLYCYIGTLKKAAEIVLKSNDKAAAYHLARQLEIAGKFQHAISYYKQAETYQHAIRLAKEKDLQQEVMQLALQSPPRVMIDAAQYFEEKGQMDKAVQLYQRGGHVAKAIDMCVQGKLFDVLASIADDIFRDNTSDPEVLRKCAEVFIQHERYDRSVQMYTRSGNYASALELCMKKNVKISEEMAEELTPPKNDDDEEYTKKRTQILRKIAKVAAMQENYTVATKKYVQAGDKLKAMKVLIKSGDTEKIIFFAVISRQRELYILAANYLQNLDWRNEPEIMKSIISFYTKAKAWKFLSNFYEACSSVEIDEYRHYEKALDALKEAQKYMTKEFKGLQPGTTQQQVAEKITQLKQRIVLVDKFILARELAKKSQDNVSGEMVKICQELLNEPSAEEAIRVGDVYALLVEFYWVQQGDGRQAYQLIQKMRDHKIILNFYLDEKMISEIYADVGVQYPTQQAAPEDGDEIEEELHYD